MAKPIFDPQASPLPEARDLWNRGRRDEALTLFLKAKKSHRHNLSASLDAARALGSCYQIQEAERVLKKLTTHCRQFPILHLLIGQSYREIRRPDKALHHFNQTLKFIPDSVDALVESAQMLERSGKVQKAMSRVQAARKLDPSASLLQIFEARLISRIDPKRGIEHYRDVLDHSDNFSPGLKSRAMHELAILIEKIHPEEALQLTTQAHTLIRPNTQALQIQGQQSAKKNLALGYDLTADFLDRANQSIPTEDRQKIVFLLGFARSGTTLLEKLLASTGSFLDAEELDLYGLHIHPLLSGTLKSYTRDDDETQKVIQFLRTRYLKGMEAYFEKPLEGHWLLDKNPSHTIICASLARTFPESQFLVMLRDPRDTLLSAYFQYLPPNPESTAFLQWDSLVQRYIDTMNAWIDLREKLSPEAWREVRYENLVAQPSLEIDALRGWLGESTATLPNRMGSQHISSPSYADVRAPVHTGRIDRWKQPAYEALFDKKIQSSLAPVMDRLGYKW